MQGTNNITTSTTSKHNAHYLRSEINSVKLGQSSNKCKSRISLERSTDHYTGINSCPHPLYYTKQPEREKHYIQSPCPTYHYRPATPVILVFDQDQ